ncbi:MAG: cytochrome C [Pseudomonadota bacterium]|nr:cytochrome C [Pseudomonadota bacterium]
MFATQAQALPVYARQTGQNCLACHAGGQFPELTPYGRMFKMTGYTIGTRTEVPLSVMGVATDAFVANTNQGSVALANTDKNAQPVFAAGSVFLAGKISDNTGGFAQATYNNYDSQDPNGNSHGYLRSDNMDFRYADHLIDQERDLIYGVSLNNHPSVTDPWNTAAAWMQYVPAASTAAYQFADATTPFPQTAAPANTAGLTTYLFWNRHLYAEAGTYRTANGLLSLLSFNNTDAQTPHLAGGWNPYWRLAWSQEWGAHNLMVGASGMVAHLYDGNDTTSAANLGTARTSGLDMQYQYLLDPHTVTAQLVYNHQETQYSPATFAASPAAALTGVPAMDSTNLIRAKLSYVYEAKYGGSLAFFSSHGSANVQGLPDTKGYTWEAFFMPVQYVRVGLQFTGYQTYAGATTNYDGLGRSAGDNNTLMLYVWGAY